MAMINKYRHSTLFKVNMIILYGNRSDIKTFDNSKEDQITKT